MISAFEIGSKTFDVRDFLKDLGETDISKVLIKPFLEKVHSSFD